MNINKVSYGLVGTVLMGVSLTGCTEPKYENKAKEMAVKYLRGDELLKAERFASQQPNYDKYSGEAITYWDSLLIEAKSKEAYLKGMQVIKDSAEGKFFRKEKFKAPLDTICSEDFIEETIKEYAKNTSAEEFIKARENAPGNYVSGAYNNKAASTHYWNLITTTGKQKYAYNKGMVDARNELIKK